MEECPGLVRDISYLSKVTGGGKPGRISTLQLGWELQDAPGGATSGQLLGFSWGGGEGGRGIHGIMENEVGRGDSRCSLESGDVPEDL